jgi:hypothetical protein
MQAGEGQVYAPPLLMYGVPSHVLCSVVSQDFHESEFSAFVTYSFKEKTPWKKGIHPAF